MNPNPNPYKSSAESLLDKGCLFFKANLKSNPVIEPLGDVSARERAKQAMMRPMVDGGVRVCVRCIRKGPTAFHFPSYWVLDPDVDVQALKQTYNAYEFIEVEPCAAHVLLEKMEPRMPANDDPELVAEWCAPAH